jgi:hypothetical protein
MNPRRYLYFAILMVCGYFAGHCWIVGQWSIAVPLTLIAFVVIALRNIIAPKTPEKKP